MQKQNLLKMKTIKISFLNTSDVKNTIIFHLIKILCKKKIIISNVDDCDLLFIGPYRYDSVKSKIFRKFFNKKFFDSCSNFKKVLLRRKISPLKIFFSEENFRHNLINADFYITLDFGVYHKNHLRFPIWKNNIDWSREGIIRSNDVQNAKRFGSFYKIEDLMSPLGSEFLKRKRNMCLFTSHLDEPRGSIFQYLSKYFIIDGYGSYFNPKIKNHNESNFIKMDIMKNYSFNLCPENSIYPGCYSEKIPDAFSAKCLPVSWADHNINIDFNRNAFVNLVDHVEDNYHTICNLLKDDSYLKKFIQEPLIVKKVNLDNEKVFVEKILSFL
jgi:hypothetical protein